MRVLVDTDPAMGVLGGDPEDAFAILLALNSPELEVVGLTTVSGNVPVALAQANARHLLALAGRSDLPLAGGALGPLMPHRVEQRRWQAAKLELPRLTPGPFGNPPVRAPQQIVEQLLAAEATTVLAIGPLTNLALALLLEPSITDRVERLVVMGGAGRGAGNVTPRAEFNFWADPEAASIVVSAGWPITLVTLEVCHQTRLTRAEMEAVRFRTELGAFARDACAPWFDDPQHEGDTGFPLFDSLAAAVLVRPDLLATRPARVEIDVTTGPSAGSDSEWFGRDVLGRDIGRGDVDVAVAVDVERFQEMFRARVLDRL